MMLKLYKRGKSSTQYWEAWEADEKSVVIHWGKLGTTGKNTVVKVEKGSTGTKTITAAAKEPRADGFSPIATKEHATLVVQYATKGWGSAKDLEKAEKVEGVLNECLGWSGNGHCDGNDIGSGTMNVFSFVVDPKLGAKSAIAALKKKKLLDGAVVAYWLGEDDPKVVHPPRFKGKFALL